MLKVRVFCPSEIELTHFQGLFSLKQVVGVHQLGVGLLAAYQSLPRIQYNNEEIWCLIGIAGSTHENQIGKAYEISIEQVLDIGTETKEGAFLSVSDLQFDTLKQYHPLFPSKVIYPEHSISSFSVACCTGTEATRTKRYGKLSEPAIENMEGYSFYSFCYLNSIPCMQIRGISNRIGERNLAEWNIKEALHSASTLFSQLLTEL